METFEEVRRYLHDVPFINNGGCAISALAMHRWLKQRGIKSEIVYYYGRHDVKRLRTNRGLRSGRLRGMVEPESCSHVLLKLNRNEYYDSDGRQTDSREHHILPPSLVLESINNEDAWNTCFDRNPWVNNISQSLGVDLSDVLVSPNDQYDDQLTINWNNHGERLYTLIPCNFITE